MEQGVKPLQKKQTLIVSVTNKIYLYSDLQVAEKPLYPAKPSIRVLGPLIATYRRMRIQ